MIFLHIFLSILLKFDFVFLYYKDTNLILKYLVFTKILQKNDKTKKMFVFMHTTKYLKDKKLMLYFPTIKEAKICYSMYFDFNNQFIKAMRTRLIF